MIFKLLSSAFLLTFVSIGALAATIRVSILSKYALTSAVITVNSGNLILDENTFNLTKSRVELTAENDTVKIRHEGRFFYSKKITVSSGDSITILSAYKIKRKYPDELIIMSRSNKLVIVNKCDFETYIHSSAVAESKGLLDNTPYYNEFIKVMEICARSYLLANGDRHGEKEWEFCDLTHCMHYEGLLDNGKPFSSGEILKGSNEKPVECFFHSTCGGILTKPDVFWDNHTGNTYREGYDFINGKNLCGKSPHYSWKAATDISKLSKVFKLKSLNRIKAVYKNGRVNKIIFETETETQIVDIPKFMSVCGRTYGWNFIKSNCFSIKTDNGSVLFLGKGLGHGVGLCQYGAAEMIRTGVNYKDVLNFYFPGATLTK